MYFVYLMVPCDLYFTSCTSILYSELLLKLFVLYCSRVPAANAPRCTEAEGLLYKPWSLIVPTCTARCLHQRPN